MLPQKKFSTFSEQVEWLQDENHLIISDRQYAEDVLKHIGYKWVFHPTGRILPATV